MRLPRPHRCKRCLKSFAFEENLQRHVVGGPFCWAWVRGEQVPEPPKYDTISVEEAQKSFPNHDFSAFKDKNT